MTETTTAGKGKNGCSRSAAGNRQWSGVLLARPAGRQREVQLRLPEPQRALEEQLIGRDFRQVPGLVASLPRPGRAAAVLAACVALERACGVEPDPGLAPLRRLLLCGAWIHMHARHLFMFHVAELLGYASPRALRQDYPEIMARGLRLGRLGARLHCLVGGRIGSVDNLVVGGFRQLPTPAALQALVPELEWAVTAGQAVMSLVSRIPYLRFERDYRFAALDSDHYVDFGDRLCVESGEALDDASLTGQTAPPWLHVGPLARVALGLQRMPPAARRLAQEAGLDRDCRSPFKALRARAVEIVCAAEQALAIIRDYSPPAAAAVPVQPRAGQGQAVAESAQGPWIYRCRLAADGTVQEARIWTPLSLNRVGMEHDLQSYLLLRAAMDDDTLLRECRHLIGSHEPALARGLMLLDQDTG